MRLLVRIGEIYILYNCDMCELRDNTFDAISGLFEKPDYGHHLGWKVCHVHFHSLEVARYLFAGWRECVSSNVCVSA